MTSREAIPRTSHREAEAMNHHLKEVAVYAVLGTLTAGGVHLVERNRTLGNQNRALLRRAIEPQPGLFVPAYPAVTIERVPVTLGAPGQHQVLIFFRTTCPYCRASTPSWNKVAARLEDQPEIGVYGVALDSADAARAYAAERELRFSVIARPDPRLVALYRVSSVPLILILNQNARIAYARLGVLTEAAAVDSVVAAARERLAAPHFVAGLKPPR
jgi:peroxiredoxin